MNNKGEAYSGAFTPASTKATVEQGKEIFKGLFIFVVSLIVIGVIFWGISVINESIGKTGKSYTPIETANSPLKSGIVSFAELAGAKIDDAVSVESIVIWFAMFAIIFAALTDILTMFSSFSQSTSLVISAGLGIIAGVTGIIEGMAKLFGIAAGLTTIGIILVIVGALIAAITLNLGVGGYIRKWRLERQAEIEGFKTASGANKTAEAIEGLKKVQKAFRDKEVV